MSDIPPLADPLGMDHENLDERIRAAFAKPPEGGALVPLPTTNVAISDAVITAQKVAVERDEAKVLQKIRVFAQAAGGDWFYRYPVNRGQDWIEGPSIKCANNVARYYGNCQIDTRVIDNGDSWIIYARFVDYETGFSYTRPFQQRKGQQTVKTGDAGRVLDIALQIGVSKAIRNVVCNALESFTTYAFEEAKSAIVDKVGKNLESYRERVTARLVEMKILERVEIASGRTAKNWLATDIARIIAQLQAINDGMATVDETWPPDAGQVTSGQEDGQQRSTEQGQQPKDEKAPSADLISKGNEAAALGTEALNAWWNGLTSAQRGVLGARGRGSGLHYEQWARQAAGVTTTQQSTTITSSSPPPPAENEGPAPAPAEQASAPIKNLFA